MVESQVNITDETETPPVKKKRAYRKKQKLSDDTEKTKPKKTLPKEKWPQIIVVRTAPNGRQIAMTYRCREVNLHFEKSVKFVGYDQGTDLNLHVSGIDAEEIKI